MITRETILQEVAKSGAGAPCVKQSVYALIVTTDHRRFVGGNWIEGNVSACPRDEEGYRSGEGYHLCHEVCNQLHHAEVSAITAAKEEGANLEGSTLYLVGHTYCCDSCQQAMADAGIAEAVIL